LKKPRYFNGGRYMIPDLRSSRGESIDVINVYNVYKKFFVNAFIILSTFI